MRQLVDIMCTRLRLPKQFKTLILSVFSKKQHYPVQIISPQAKIEQEESKAPDDEAVPENIKELVKRPELMAGGNRTAAVILRSRPLNEAERSDAELKKRGFEVFTNAVIMKSGKHGEESYVFK